MGALSPQSRNNSDRTVHIYKESVYQNLCHTFELTHIYSQEYYTKNSIQKIMENHGLLIACPTSNITGSLIIPIEITL